MITSNVFKRHQSEALLDQVHGNDNYYWYLHCKETKQKALKPLGEVIQNLGGSCLDIGCGEGWLASYVSNIQYTGIDASNEAIRKARQQQPYHRRFEVARLEDFANQQTNQQYSTLIFGNVLWGIIKFDYYVPVIEQYISQFNPDHFIIYDLQRLMTRDIDRRYKCVGAFAIELNIANIPDVKRHRQVKTYQCE